MPDAGRPIADLLVREGESIDATEMSKRAAFVNDCAQVAMRHGLFFEWLESFVGAWSAGADVYESAQAGLIEWDMA